LIIQCDLQRSRGLVRPGVITLGVMLGFLLGAGLAQAGDTPPAARDAGGLPFWEIAVWNDFPVRLELEDNAAVAALLEKVPLASFSREQLTPGTSSAGTPLVVFTPRVTEAEAAALAAAGYRFTRLADGEKSGRQAMEEGWAHQGLKSGAEAWREAAGYYPTHAQIGSIFAQMENDHPDICRAFTWGQSVQGRELWGLVVSADPQNTAAEPEVRLSSSMHGNEPVGLVLLMNLADYLTANYQVAGFEDVTELVDNYEIHIMPLHNPDGYVAGTRENAHDVDLNRNFTEPAGTHPTVEIENTHFMDYANGQHFVISENMHGGALVVNYPWDYTFTLNPDDAALIPLSLEYSTRNLPMYYGAFPQGITNGAAWYVTTGCLQDWSYEVTGCIDVTIEVGNLKTPPAGDLDGYWDDNRESLLAFVKAARNGINGVVTDASTGTPLDATITVSGNIKPVTTDPGHGDYYKLLPTGTYDLVFEAAGHVTRTVTGVTTTWGTPTVLDVALEAEASAVPGRPQGGLRLAAAPNPFNPRTTFYLTSPRAGRATLDVFDLQGRRVVRLVEGYLSEGVLEVNWDGTAAGGQEVGAGVYFARLTSADDQALVKVVLVK